MRKFYLKIVLPVWIFVLPLFPAAGNVICVQNNIDFGQKERADIISTLNYQLINTGVDTISVMNYNDAAPFSQVFATMHIAPGDTMDVSVNFDRSATESNYTAILEVLFANDTLSINVSGSIVDNTPVFTENEIQHWVGSGSGKAILVIDFNSGLETESFAFGYQFEGNPTAEDMLNDLTGVYPDLIINMAGGFLMDLSYMGQTGVGGNPEWWMTCSRTQSGLWSMNWGISTVLTNGDWFGCTYSPVDDNWNPIYLPENPVPAPAPGSITGIGTESIGLYPNPASDFISFPNNETEDTYAYFYDCSGKIVLPAKIIDKKIDIRSLPAGLYFVRYSNIRGIQKERFIKI